MKLFSILPESLTEYQSNKAKALGGLDFSLFVNQKKDPYVRDSIGFINIKGCLMRDSTPIDRMLGSTDYSDIVDDCEYCLKLGAKALVFVIDSPGGMVSGLIETAEFIESLSVPTIGYVDGLCCSAAYHLAAGMTYLISTKSSSTGNVGAVLCYVDASKSYEANGVSFNVFTNDGAELKSIGYGPELTDVQKEFLQESINETGNAFKQFVLENRPNIDPEVFRAGWYGGVRALELGLIDDIGDDDDAIDYATQLANRFSI